MLAEVSYGSFQFQSGPYLGILRPWAQENFAPPPLFVRIVMCKQKQHKKLTKDKTL